MLSRRPWTRRILIVSLTLFAAQQVWRHGHDYVFPEEFVEVEPGRLYRGAWQKDWPMRRIIENYHIRTIVALAHQPDHPLAVQERALAEELGVRWLHIPIVERQKGNRRDAADALERAAEALADPDNQPVFFHCHHGRNRASLAQVAYRTLYDGWSLERALAEIEDQIGLVKVDKAVDYRYMTTFYNEHVLPRRRAETAATTGSQACRK